MRKMLTIYRTAYDGLSPAVWWLSLVMLINRSGTMVIPFMTLYLTKSLNYTLGQAGFVMSLFGLGAICGGFLGGRLSDRFGFYNIQLAALAGGGIMFILLGQMTSYPLICIFTFLLSLVNDAFRPANSLALAHYSKEENRTRSFSLNRLAINLGWAAGGSLGGFLASRNYELLFWVDGVTNIGAAVLLLFVLSPGKSSANKEKHQPVVRDKQFSAWRDKPYLLFVALTTIFAFCFFQIFTTLPVYYKDHLRMSENNIGIVMAINGLLIALFEMIIIFKLEGRRTVLNFISLGTFILAFSFIVFNVMPGGLPVAIFAMLICTIGEILSMPFMNTFWIGRSNNNNRGQYAAFFTMSWAIAQVTGPWAGAQIAAGLGFEALWWTIGGLCILCAAGYELLKKWIDSATGLPGTK